MQAAEITETYWPIKTKAKFYSTPHDIPSFMPNILTIEKLTSYTQMNFLLQSLLRLIVIVLTLYVFNVW